MTTLPLSLSLSLATLTRLPAHTLSLRSHTHKRHAGTAAAQRARLAPSSPSTLPGGSKEHTTRAPAPAQLAREQPTERLLRRTQQRPHRPLWRGPRGLFGRPPLVHDHHPAAAAAAAAGEAVMRGALPQRARAPSPLCPPPQSAVSVSTHAHLAPSTPSPVLTLSLLSRFRLAPPPPPCPPACPHHFVGLILPLPPLPPSQGTRFV